MLHFSYTCSRNAVSSPEKVSGHEQRKLLSAACTHFPPFRHLKFWHGLSCRLQVSPTKPALITLKKDWLMVKTEPLLHAHVKPRPLKACVHFPPFSHGGGIAEQKSTFVSHRGPKKVFFIVS